MQVVFCSLSVPHSIPPSFPSVYPPSLSLPPSQAHLIEGRTPQASTLDSARQNLAATFVNAFVNAGFGQVGSLLAVWLGESSRR